MGRDQRKRGIAVSGPWQPVPLAFLRSRACAELSPHGAKLLLNVLGMLSTNAQRNGDICLTPKLMLAHGWSGRQTLNAATAELETYGLLFKTRQGSRLDCSLWACTLYPLDCDLSKLDVRPGAYSTSDWMQGGELEKPPTKDKPAVWRRARNGAATGQRKAAKTKTVAPPRDDLSENVPPRDERNQSKPPKSGTSSRPGTKPLFSSNAASRPGSPI